VIEEGTMAIARSRLKQPAQTAIGPHLVDSDCPICLTPASFKVVHHFEDNLHYVVACNRCSVQTILPHPTSRDVNEFYADYHVTRTPEEHMPFLINKSIDLFDHLRKEGYLPSNFRTVRYLEAGFGNGASVLAAAQLGMQTFGFDLDPSNVADVLRRLKSMDLRAHVTHGDAHQVLDKGETVDFIKASQIIEHLIDPVEFVNSMSGLLSRDGYLYLECPNNSAAFFQIKNRLRRQFGRMQYYNSLRVSEHLWGFNRASMTELLQTCGDQVVFCADYHIRHKYIQPENRMWYPSVTSGVIQSIFQKGSYPLLKSLIGVFDLAASKTLSEGLGLAALARKRSATN
jgi:2-polyprenyl-3-methyl-5-hydroxy-6-metoxy-1,4-benzoquinol methylase